MATEINLKPGWLLRDVRRAAQRVAEWAKRGQPTEVRCSHCGGETQHVCSWVCVEMCPTCDGAR